MLVSVGDGVKIVTLNGKVTLGEVLVIEPRFVEYKRGLRSQPLLTIETTQHEISCFDQSYVTDIVYRSKVRHAPYNRYAKMKEDSHYISTDRKGVMFGSIEVMARYYLGLLPFEIKTQINLERLYTLFKKDRPGLILSTNKHLGYWYYIRKKVFKKWIHNNYTRIVNTIAEQVEIDTLQYADECEEYLRI